MNATALERAQVLLARTEREASVAGHSPLPLHAWRALAWSLKDECLAAWTADPPRTRLCAQVLARMEQVGPDVEVSALADWTAGIAALAGGQLAEAVPLLDSAHFALTAVSQPKAAGETLVPKVMALAMLGRHEEALECGETARSMFVGRGDGHAAGRVELNLGTLLFRLDRHAEAARMYRSAAVHFARARDDARSILADIGLAHALTWLFDFDEALRINHRALRRAAQRALLVPQAQARGAIGRIELLRGRYHRALTELAQALALMDEAGAPPQQRVEAAGALADTYLAVNLLPEAHDLYDQVIEVAQNLDAPTEEARARVERARVRGRLGHHDAALEDLQRALALFRQAGNAVAAADAELASGQIHVAAGDTVSAASHARAAMAALQGSGVVGWQLDAEQLAAAAALHAGDLGGAEAGFAGVLARARALGLVPQEVAAQVGQGEVALRAGRTAEAIEALGRALDLVEAARAELADDEFRVALASLGERAHSLLVQATAWAQTEGDASVGELFEAIERWRARALTLGVAALPEAAAEGGESAEAVASVETGTPDPLEARVQFLRQRWRDLITAGHGGDLDQHAKELRELEGQWLEEHRRLRLRPQAPADTRPEVAWARAETVQEALGPHEAVVAFQLEGDEITACVVRRHAAVRVSWPVPGLVEAIEGLRFQIDTPRHQTALLQSHAGLLAARVRTRAAALYTMLWAPMAPCLHGVDRVALVPHRALHYVPWCALHDGQGWLVEQIEISLSASASAWLAARARPWRAPARVLALGAASGSLPYVQAEVQAIARIVGAGAQVLLGGEARADALKRQANEADIVHLACHGQFRADNPAFSLLDLAEGPLTLHDLRSLRLRAALVVLSACETGLSRVAAGDELIGLVRGFTLAGAEAVLATQWAVADASMADLMASLYRHLMAGETPAAALRAAQREAITAGGHPFQWAALSLYGRG